MSELCKNAIAFLQSRFPTAPVSNSQAEVSNIQTGEIERIIWPMIAQDPQSGVKQRAIAVENLGEVNELEAIAQAVDGLFSQLDSGIFIEMGNTIKPTGQSINTTQDICTTYNTLYK